PLLRVLIRGSLLLPILPDARRAPPGAAYSLQPVDKADRRARLARLLEQVAHATGANADDHLDEFAGAHAEKRHVGFAGHRPGEQRLAGAGRSNEQDALRHGTPQPGVLLRISQKINDLDELVFGVVDAGHVVERDALRLAVGLVVAFRSAAPDAEQTAAGRLTSAVGQPQKAAYQQNGGTEAKQQVQPPRRGLIE